ncbi:lipid asymmetry ABC transporter MlaABCDEF, periplasmic component MlaD [Campylobacter iguaniorum]|uniref:MlaD family protein n=1 Tax=Campylobacter iguaniorum TaxID=1244531 RepID=UPI0007C8FA54|nr:MlaD family protein [Campylobacter iguaniorum]ANE35584.1 lipid asymmetry ABC transporter MlaABCDEF, periplasmic component MlaD [Campylobacter iguaniorum]
MESRSSYFVAGLFFCLTLGLLVFFLLYMNINGNKSENRYYYIETKELPNGIKKDSQVRFIGVLAGFVNDIYFSDPKTATIEIKMSIKKDLPIKKDSLAVVEVQGISGIAYINIDKGSNESETFNENEKAVIKMGESLLAKIGNSAISLSENIAQSIARIELLLSNENINNIALALNSINKFTSTLANEQNLNSINATLKNLNLISDNISKLNFEPLIGNINSFLLGAQKSTQTFEISQAQLLKKLQSGEYDFKSVLSPTLQNTNDTLMELQSLIYEIKNTLFRLEDNPYEFFFKDRKGDEK